MDHYSIILNWLLLNGFCKFHDVLAPPTITIEFYPFGYKYIIACPVIAYTLTKFSVFTCLLFKSLYFTLIYSVSILIITNLAD